jgi:hypothetical protein
MSADRVDSNSLPLTQEFLGQMLGTRRSSVTVAGWNAAEGGLNRSESRRRENYRPTKVEEAACDCYGIMQRQGKEWQDGSQ